MGQVLSAKLESLDVQLDKRIAGRRHLSLQVAGNVESAQNFNAIVRDLSQTGFLMESSVNLTRGEMIYVELPRRGRVSAEVAWTDGHRAGCRFVQSISAGSVSAALLGALPEQRAFARNIGAQIDSADASSLSRRHKLGIMLALAALAWGVILSFIYVAFRFLNA
jgi:hypothetical protein